MDTIKAFTGVNKHFSLFIEGVYEQITNDNIMTVNLEYINYAFYTYPHFRRVYVFRACMPTEKGESIPNIDGPIHIISRYDASKVDKFKKSISYFRTKYDPLILLAKNDRFYNKLEIINSKRGPVDYVLLYKLYLSELL